MIFLAGLPVSDPPRGFFKEADPWRQDSHHRRSRIPISISKMLLRSGSSPILNSWIIRPTNNSYSDHDLHPWMRKNCPVARPCLIKPPTATLNSPFAREESFKASSSRKLYKALSETDLRDLSASRRKAFVNSSNGLPAISAEEEETIATISPSLLSRSGLDESTKNLNGKGVAEGTPGALLSFNGFGSVAGDGGIRGGGGGGDGRWSDFGDKNHGNESLDSYYRKMIEADPGNALLLSNYSMFLKEVRGDLSKAEEYCGRAILANPGDGHTLSLYGDLIWHNQRNAERAENYFDQAIKAAPDDCYVMASYARFLWDAEDDEAENQEGEATPLFSGTTPSQATSSL